MTKPIPERAQYKSFLIALGWCILTLTIAVIIAIYLEVLSIDIFSIKGGSGIRTIAGIAILGCLSAALGYLEE